MLPRQIVIRTFHNHTFRRNANPSILHLIFNRVISESLRIQIFYLSFFWTLLLTDTLRFFHHHWLVVLYSPLLDISSSSSPLRQLCVHVSLQVLVSTFCTSMFVSCSCKNTIKDVVMFYPVVVVIYDLIFASFIRRDDRDLTTLHAYWYVAYKSFRIILTTLTSSISLVLDDLLRLLALTSSPEYSVHSLSASPVISQYMISSINHQIAHVFLFFLFFFPLLQCHNVFSSWSFETLPRTLIIFVDRRRKW